MLNNVKNLDNAIKQSRILYMKLTNLRADYVENIDFDEYKNLLQDLLKNTNQCLDNLESISSKDAFSQIKKHYLL